MSAWAGDQTTSPKEAVFQAFPAILLKNVFGPTAYGILVPQLETEPMPLQWKGGVLTMRPLGKSLFVCAKISTYFVCSASGAPREIHGSGAPRKRLDHKPITIDHVRRQLPMCVSYSYS